jgi:hypothetical protein
LTENIRSSGLALASEPLVARLAAIIDISGLRLGAVGELSQQVKDLGVPVLRDQPFDAISTAAPARLANDRQRRVADVREGEASFAIGERWHRGENEARTRSAAGRGGGSGSALQPIMVSTMLTPIGPMFRWGAHSRLQRSLKPWAVDAAMYETCSRIRFSKLRWQRLSPMLEQPFNPRRSLLLAKT